MFRSSSVCPVGQNGDTCISYQQAIDDIRSSAGRPFDKAITYCQNWPSLKVRHLINIYQDLRVSKASATSNVPDGPRPMFYFCSDSILSHLITYYAVSDGDLILASLVDWFTELK
jgi:hypothetical protein